MSERLHSVSDLLAATGHDPAVRSFLRRWFAGAWAADGAVAVLGTDPEDRVTSLLAIGPPVAAARLVAGCGQEMAAAAGTQLSHVSLPRGAQLLLGRGWRWTPRADWDLRYLRHPPPAPLPPLEDVVDLAAVGRLLAVANPGASARPGDAAVRGWVGIRASNDAEPRALLAVAADTSPADTLLLGHISSIATLPAARGRGLGAAVTAGLARRQLERGADLVTLGHYAGNQVAARMYTRLGFAHQHAFSGGALTPA